jgi:hypothetical protein
MHDYILKGYSDVNIITCSIFFGTSLAAHRRNKESKEKYLISLMMMMSSSTWNATRKWKARLQNTFLKT